MTAIMDCTIRSAAELTGVRYAEALRMLGDKYVTGIGATGRDLVTALEAAGLTVSASPLTLDEALDESEDGRRFLVVGRQGRTSHAWTIMNGNANRPLGIPDRHQLYEVS